MLFIDASVLLYAISTDPAEARKTAEADYLLRTMAVVVSAQVLEDFYLEATRLTRPDRLDPLDAASLVASFRRFPVAETTAELVIAAMTTHQSLGIRYADAAIIESARSMGCDRVLSEDIDERPNYAGMRVHNPFGRL